MSKNKISQSATKAEAPVRDLSTLSQLQAHLKLDKCDFILVGDGSGSGWDMDAGWAVVCIDCRTFVRKLFYGAISPGTVSLGEVLPYLHALLWLNSVGPGAELRHRRTTIGQKVRIAVVSDSEYACRAGSHPESRKTYRELWMAFDYLCGHGYEISWHYCGRSRSHLNVLVDEVSRSARKALADVYKTSIGVLAKQYPELPLDVTPYDFSP